MVAVSRIHKEDISGLRRVRLVFDTELPTIPEAMHKARKLLTFFYSTRMYRKQIPENVSDHVFMKWRYLHVLDLSNTDQRVTTCNCKAEAIEVP